MAAEECAVCCEKFTGVVRKQIPCGWCAFVVCSVCTQRFLLDLPDTPSCMNCKHVWSREYLEAHLKKTFLNGALKKHREELLLEIEKGLLPETQPHAENAKKTIELDDKRKVFSADLKKVRDDLYRDRIQGRYTIKNLEIHKNLCIRASTLKEEIKYLQEVKAVFLRTHPPGTAIAAAESQEKRSFIKPCPAIDCRGFLSTGWKCGLCNTTVCPKCHEIKSDAGGEGAAQGEPHVCNPEILATVEALAKDSKPCPKCGSMIQKIEGCSQMFHTPLSGGCGAIFDWNTLRLHTNGAIHNPHWYEYQRHLNGGTVPRQVGDVPCGGAPALHQILERLQQLYSYRYKNAGVPSDIVTKFSDIHRSYGHNQYVELPRYAVNMVNDNRDLRISYLLNRMNEKKFKQMIQQREKAREKKTHISMVMNMYQGALADILTRVSASPTLEAIKGCLDEIDALILYTNDAMSHVSKIYTCVRVFVSSKDYKFKTYEPPPPPAQNCANL